VKPQFKHTGLSARPRFVIAMVFYTLAALLQFFMADGFFLLRLCSFVLLAVPFFFLSAKSFSNKIVDVGKEDWKPVTQKEIDRLQDRLANIRKVKTPIYYNKFFAIMLMIFFPFVLCMIWALFDPPLIFIFIDLFLVFLPFFWFARVDKWYPADLAAKLAVFMPVITYSFGENYKLTPMLRFVEDKEGRKIPEDVRFMLEFSNFVCSDGKSQGVSNPADAENGLLGVQFQATFNNGPNGKVPYLYAVFITKGGSRAWNALQQLSYKRFITEKTESEENGKVYGTVVLRLDTKSRADGYHTKSADVKQLAENVTKALANL
jgi:hypothetical protein